jgi:DNA modification methylase
MKEIPDKTFDLCLTDPPYFEGFKSKATTSKKIDYTVEKVTREWFNESLRVCKSVVFTPGYKNFYIYPPAKMIGCWYKGGTMGRNLTGGISNWEPVLFYGELTMDVDYIYESVQKARMNEYKKTNLIHPCPKPTGFYKKILKYIKPKPKSIFDPFLGSGTVAQVSEELGLFYRGFEINEQYILDIEKRIHIGEKNRKSTNLDGLR